MEFYPSAVEILQAVGMDRVKRALRAIASTLEWPGEGKLDPDAAIAALEPSVVLVDVEYGAVIVSVDAKLGRALIDFELVACLDREVPLDPLRLLLDGLVFLDVDVFHAGLEFRGLEGLDLMVRADEVEGVHFVHFNEDRAAEPHVTDRRI